MCNPGQVVHTPVPLFTKQYKLVPMQAGSYTGTPRNTLAQCPRTCSFGWCLAGGYRNGDQRRPMGHWALGRTLDFLESDFHLPAVAFQIIC